MDAVPTTHPTEQTLQSYGLGKLDGARAESLNQHLETCDECRQKVVAVSADRFLGRAPEARGAMHSTFGQSLLNAAQSKKSAKPAPPADTLPPGLAEHPDYKILKELGRGGMGVVYLAHNELMGRDEVLKVMSRQIMERPGVLDRFLREIRAVAKLRHPNIVTAYSAFRLQENLVFAMEYVDGLDLAKLVKAKGQLPVAHACHFVHQAALGLQNAHENGLVHRDIKPHNLMLSRTGDRAVVKVLDFGLAKATREEKVDTALTSAGQALGTPDFIAPEQILDAQTADIRADIYSLGGTLFYLLTGRPPFKANSLYDLYQAHISRDLDPLNIIRPAVPSELAALVGRMMAKETKGRFQTPDEVARALVPFFKRGSATALPRPLSSVAATPPPVAPTPAVAPTISSPVVPAEPQWQSLIPDMEPEKAVPVAASKAAPSPPRTRRRFPMMVGMWLFGLFVLLAGVTLKLKLEGAIVAIENLPDGATVAVDDKAVAPARDGEKTTLKLTHGEHHITVDLSGERRHQGTVTVDWGAADPVVIKIKPVPSMASQPEPEPSQAAPVALAAEGTTAGQERDDNGLRMKSSWRPPGGLVAFYGFDDGRAEDLSGHGHHGEFSANRPVKAPGTEGEGLTFNSAQHNYIALPLNINPDVMPQITMGGWFRINQPNRDQTLISHDDGWYDRALVIDGRGRKDGKKRWSAFNGQKVVAVADVEAERWTFVALRHDQTTAKLTIDVNDARVAHPGLYGSGWKKTFIGRNPFFGDGADLDGRVDNVFFFNRVLDDKEIDAIRAQGSAAILPKDPAPAVTTAAPAALAPPTAEAGFAPLFNGRDLTGWTFPRGNQADWSVRDGTIRGTASVPFSIMATIRNDYGDFHLRMEIRRKMDRGPAIHVRGAIAPDDIRCYVFLAGGRSRPNGTVAPVGGYMIKTSAAPGAGDGLLELTAPVLPPLSSNAWHNVEMIATGNVFRMRVDGREVSAFQDTQARFMSGHIAIRMPKDGSVEIRRIEIKETKTVPKKADRPANKPRAPMTAGARVGQERADNGLKMKFCWCPAGRSWMGSPPNEPGRLNNEGPAPVTLSRGFWMGKFEVTQAQWTQLMGTTIEQQNAKAGKPDLRGVGPAFPMYFVSHAEAEEFARKLTLQERGADRLPSNWEYRLPTEAEWEYACRAGTTTATAFGGQLGSTDANCMGHEHPYNGALKGPYLAQTCPVGSYRPNACGVYDMHGNVWEWCRDGYAEDLAGGVDPQGSANSSERVLRGGGWITWPVQCRSAGRRGRRKPSDRLHDLGFRLVLALAQ